MQRNTTSKDHSNFVNDVIASTMVGACLAVSYAVSGCSDNLSTICKLLEVIEEGVGGSVQTMALASAVGVGAFYCVARLFPAEDMRAENSEQVSAKSSCRQRG
jgi:hypothetical protein